MKATDTEPAGLPRFRDAAGLAAHLLERCPPGRRILVGIAGIPGSGKSTLAAHLREAIDRLAGRPGLATVVAQDGFHLTNAELARRDLASRKGSPPTFDAAALLGVLSALRRADAVVRVPIYSRELHEPVPDAVAIPPETPIILVEGNYLFWEEGVWGRVAALFDIRVFVAVGMDLARERVIARHVRGGLSAEAAVAKYERSDRANSELVAATVSRADCLFATEFGLRGGSPP